MKNSKNKKLIVTLVIGVIAALFLIAIVVGFITGNDKEKPTNEPTTQLGETISDVIIDDNIIDNLKETEDATEKGIEIIRLEEPETSKPTTQKPSNQQTNTIKPASPVKPGNPSGVSQGNNTEIIDNGNDSVKEYSCGTKGHHCDSKETHNFILSLENKGCPYCGSHSCKSFYTYDEWGNACYDPTRCESYTEKMTLVSTVKIVVKVGTGSGNTCVRFTVDTKCPECGKTVKAKTCHSH